MHRAPPTSPCCCAPAPCPRRFKVVEERTVGPELGADSIRAGALSLLTGFVLVIFFMGTFYGLFGWFANIALVVNLVLMLAILSLFTATLTLPGMAGLLLTLGMAVDANILINERIREETKNGRTPLRAMETGFKRAFGTILDSNVTAFLAHVMLFVFGSGPVKGFRAHHHDRHRHDAVYRYCAGSVDDGEMVYLSPATDFAGCINQGQGALPLHPRWG